MLNPAEIERKLRALTERQRQILYWIGQGLDYIQIGEKFSLTESAIQAEMTRVYRDFGLTKKKMMEKRRILVSEVLPVLDRLIKNPDTALQTRVEPPSPPPNDPEVQKEVAEDAKQGFVPIDRSLVRRAIGGLPVYQRPRSRPETNPQDTEQGPVYSISPRPQDPMVIRPSNPLPWLLVGILGTLLLVALAVVGVLWASRTDSPKVATLPTIVTRVVSETVAAPQTVIMPQTVVVKETVVVPQTVPIPQTVIVTQAPGIAVQPSPATAASSGPTAVSGPANLAGKVASDFPGTKIGLDSPVTSVVDENTKEWDIYAIDLAAGQEIRLAISFGTEGCLNASLFNPGSKSLDSGKNSEAFWQYWCSNSGDWKKNFTPATSGTYFIGVQARNSGVRYTLSVSVVK